MIPISYNYRNLIVRWKTTLMTASGFTLVVAALIVMLAFVKGIEEVCATSGELENVIVLAKGNSDEVFSNLDMHLVTEVESSKPNVSTQTRLLSSRELFMVVHHYADSQDGYRFLQVRGVLPPAFEVHTKVKIVDGEPLRGGQSQVIIGRAIQREQGLMIGDTIQLGRKDWTVAGVFESDGSAFETEVWCDLGELASQFRREGTYSTVVLRTESPEVATSLAEQLANSRSISVNAQTETAYYEKQAEQTKTIQTAAWVISWFMGIGAIFGVMNTMFAAIGQRTKDIAVMRILGFKPHEILISFLLEAILISIVGGLLGASLGYATNGLTQSAGVGGKEVEFAFHVDSTILMIGACFTLAMGVLGGLLPAMSVVGIKPLEALR